MTPTTQKRRASKPRVTNKQIADEIRRMRVSDRIYSAGYVGRVRSGYDHSEDLQKYIAQALANIGAAQGKSLSHNGMSTGTNLQ